MTDTNKRLCECGCGFEIGSEGFQNLHVSYFSEESLRSLGLTSSAIQRILHNQAIVEGLHSFISHCDEMIESYESQLKNPKDKHQERFLESQIEEWGRKKNDLTELIKYKTTEYSTGSTEEK